MASTTPVHDELVDMYYIAFVQHNGMVWGLDGGKMSSILHGEVKFLGGDVLRIIEEEFVPHISWPEQRRNSEIYYFVSD